MNWVFVDQFDDVLIADVVGDEMNFLRNTFRCVVFVLQEGESGPLEMFSPKFENGFGSLQRTPSGKMKNSVLTTRDRQVVEIAGSETGEVTGGVDFTEDLQRMFALANDVIDLFESWDVTLGEAFLVWDEEIGFCGTEPPGEDSLEEDVGVESLLLSKPICVKRNAATMTHSDLVSGCSCDGVDEIDVAIQTDTIGSGDDI